MKRSLIFLILALSSIAIASPVRSLLGGREIVSEEGETPLYDSLVEYIGFSETSSGNARYTNIVISDVPWDSFSISLYVPSTSLVGYRGCTGGAYSYLGCNRIGFTNTRTYRGGASFMGIQDGVSVVTDKFVEYVSPSPTRLFWTIDGTDYSVAACRNPGGDFGLLNDLNSGAIMGYYVAWCKLYYKGELTLDLVPVRFTNESGKREGGMLDLLSGTLYRKNVGTGEFEIGPDL